MTNERKMEMKPIEETGYAGLNTPDLLEKIRAKVEETVPDVLINAHAQLIGWDRKVTYFKQYRPVTISDILRALNAVKIKWTLSALGLKVYISDENGAHETLTDWDLTKDADNQNEETLTFISSVLGVV